MKEDRVVKAENQATVYGGTGQELIQPAGAEQQQPPVVEQQQQPSQPPPTTQTPCSK